MLFQHRDFIPVQSLRSIYDADSTVSDLLLSTSNKPWQHPDAIVRVCNEVTRRVQEDPNQDHVEKYTSVDNTVCFQQVPSVHGASSVTPDIEPVQGMKFIKENHNPESSKKILVLHEVMAPHVRYARLKSYVPTTVSEQKRKYHSFAPNWKGYGIIRYAHTCLKIF